MDQVSVLTWRVPDADAKVLEQATLSGGDLATALRQMRDATGVPGLTYLATCQRVLWVLQDDADDVAERLVRAYRELLGRALPAPERHDRFAAFAHLCEVASSLDALVPGEPQVLGQVKAAVQRCQEAGLHTTPLEHMWQFVFRTAKTVRSQTALFHGKVSLVPLTQEHIEAALAGVETPRAVVLGTGEIGRRTIDRVRAVRPDTDLHVVSRDLQRAHDFAAVHDATGHTFEAFLADPPELDLLVCAMRGDGPVLPATWLEAAAARRPLTVLDLAMPRNAEPPATPHERLRLVQMDDLTRISQQNKARRDDALEHARIVLADEVDKVRHEYQLRCHASTLYRLTQRFQEVAETRWDNGPRDRKWYDQTVRALLHEATTVLKEDV